MKRKIDINSFNYKRALIFLLSLSVVGTGIPVIGQLVVIALMIDSYKRNKYDFIIQLFLLMGAWTFFGLEDFVPNIKIHDVILPFLFLLFLFEKSYGILRKIKISIIIFWLGIFVLMLFSDESIMLQLRGFRHFFGIVYFIVPVFLFKRKNFNLEILLKRLTAYSIIMAAMVIIQAFTKQSLFFHDLEGFRDGQVLGYQNILFGRIYPPPLVLIALSLFYRHYVKYSKPLILLFVVAFVVTLTNSLWIATLALLMVPYVKVKQVYKFAFVGFFVLSLFFIDKSIPAVDFRIYSSYNRIEQAIVNEEYDRLGTGRMAQALPSIEYISENSKSLTGIGLVTEEVTGDKYMIDKEFSSGVMPHFIGHIEITQIALWTHLGWLGLLWIYSFLFFLIIKTRKYRTSLWLKEILVFFFLMGVGGFYGFEFINTYIVLGMLLGVAILNERKLIVSENKKKNEKI